MWCLCNTIRCTLPLPFVPVSWTLIIAATITNIVFVPICRTYRAFVQVFESITTIQNTMIRVCMNSFHTHCERADKLLCSICVCRHFIWLRKQPGQHTQEIIETTV